MIDTAHRAIAVVGVGAILPDAPDAGTFWSNVRSGRYSVGDVPSDRWDPALYWDPDPHAPDKTYSKIGAFVRDFPWDPIAWKLPIPPRVADAMDDAQKWAVACTRAALTDYGWPDRAIDPERTAVILGNAMAGERHYVTALRISFPQYARFLDDSGTFAALPPETRAALLRDFHDVVGARLPDITEDTMPGELANCMAGRIANLFNLHGPNFVCDAACASAMAAISAAVEGLVERDYDLVVTGGVDRNMGASTYVKFCKIGALSATGTRPYADGADGFVMGEGAAVFLLKRLADAERAGDTIYAVLRGIAGASDGKGKGITAPNPVGQRLAIQRAWQQAGLRPAPGTLVEGHGTSTRVGDVVEVQSLSEAFAGAGLPVGSIALGSVKSNIGHLKGAAGAAGLLKAVLALREKTLPPSLHCERTNPNVDFAQTPLRVQTALAPWDMPRDGVRTAAVSAFGFGGTNFHAVLEEWVPGRLDGDAGRRTVAVPERITPSAAKVPLRGALVLGASDRAELVRRLDAVCAAARGGDAPPPQVPRAADLRAPERLVIDYGDATELAERGAKALRALAGDVPTAWKALRAQGIFRGRGPAAPAAFLYTGQGSQYANMLAGLRAVEPLVAETFAEADRVMTPLLGRPLTSYVFVDGANAARLAEAEDALKQTAITQPAVLATDLALTRLLAAYGITPDRVMGHSLGEYGALVAAGALPLADALEAVSARGREMTNIAVDDNGAMAAVMAPLADIERIVAGIDGYVVVANVNSRRQAVIGGATAAVERAVAMFQDAGLTAFRIPVSHAFHTRIVAPASAPLRQTLARLRLTPPSLPVVANVTGDFYPMGPGTEETVLDLLTEQVASPVQFVRGLETLYAAGNRVFVEVGPKKALQGFVDDVLGEHDDVVSLFTNHPKLDDVAAFNQALCGLYAAGHGFGAADRPTAAASPPAVAPPPAAAAPPAIPADRYTALGHVFADALVQGWRILGGERAPVTSPIVVTGAALGLPGTAQVFDDGNVGRLLRGEQLIDVIPTRHRQAILDKHITRLVKRDEGTPSFEVIDDAADVIKLAARKRRFDLGAEFGIDAERLPALDIVTQLAIAAGLDALRDAGIPLVMRYRATSTGGRLPTGWGLPDALADDTGVIFASAFPGYDALLDEVERFHADRARRERLAELEHIRARVVTDTTEHAVLLQEVDRRLTELRRELATAPYAFDRRFLFRVLSMGHSQFAELIGARGPNTAINAACASTTQAVSLAEDWIRAGRCRRVVVVAADDVTSDRLIGWIGAGFLATGAAATDDDVRAAALPFDRRRHGMIMGMGAAALVLESADAARERGLTPICEVLSAVTANSAFHGTRLDVHHIAAVMERLVAQAEACGADRRRIAAQTLFMSHETYTPARGGSAAAEVEALRHVFGADADRIVVANTKGFTGHPMGVGIEDVVAVKALETGLVPPVPNYREPDPELGALTLSQGGTYPVEYALRLGAGFGSQISMTLLRRVPPPDGERRSPEALGYAYRIADRPAWTGWLAGIAGHADPELEIVDRTLRVHDAGGARRAAAAAPAPERRREAPAPPIAGAAPTPPPTPPIAPPPGAADAVEERVLALVAAKTGYPRDMLELDLDLEADLGVDTVKQAEMFATIREAYDIPRDPKLRLRDFPTLRHVIGFVRDRRPDRAAAAPAPSTNGGPPPEAADDVEERVLALVAAKTGYPRDMLELDLDLEADLGVDTVKQAEMFATIREAYDIPRDPKLRLRDFPTLRHVIGFVRDRRPDRAAATPAAPTTTTGGRAAPTAATDGFPRRVPVAVLRPPLDACKPTGIALGTGARVVVMPDAGGVASALATLLGQRGVEVLLCDPQAAPTALDARLAAWRDAGPIAGVYWLPALDADPPWQALDLAAWRAALDVRVKRLHATMQRCYDDVARAGTFLVAGTRLGGRHGYDAAGPAGAMGGAVCGFVKAYKRERPEALVKAVDVDATAAAADVAQRLLDETLRDPGAVEVGSGGDTRWTVGLIDAPATGGRPGLTLGTDTVVVVTGAAGSIVSAITADLTAAAGGGAFHLLDRIPAPDPDSPDIVRLGTDRDGLKRDLFERLKARGERATPALVERELAALERSQAALAAIDAVRAAGGMAAFHSVDLTDSAAVAAVVDRIRAAHGRIDLLLHGAGMEISRFLPDKSADEFARVFDVKVDGWFNLLHALGDVPLGAAVVFSSIAGRFGNGGQTDYSAANDLLCKSIASFRTTRPATRGVAIDWTAWRDIGMAARGSIPTMMAAAGIDMLPPAVGIPIVRREITAGAPATAGEVVVAGALGVLLEEVDPTGGLDPAALAASCTGPMIERVVGMPVHVGLVAESTLDPRVQPFLFDHQIDGTPVLPGVMGLEAFVELARLAAPGWTLGAIEDVRFETPVKFYRHEPRTLELIGLPCAEGDDVVVACRLVASRALAGQTAPQITTHFTARVRLVRDREPLPAVAVPATTGDGVGPTDIYRVFFHGPAYQVLAQVGRADGGAVGVLAEGLPPDHTPPERPTVAAPRAIELCFQTAGIWSIATTGELALPHRVGAVQVQGDPERATSKVVALVTPTTDGGYDARVVDAEGRVYVVLRDYRTVALPGAVPAAERSPMEAALT